SQPKLGFSIPHDFNRTSYFHAVLYDLLLAPGALTRALLDRALVERWLRQFRDARAAPAARGGAISRAGLYQRVFEILSLELWLQDHRLSWRGGGRSREAGRRHERAPRPRRHALRA